MSKEIKNSQDGTVFTNLKPNTLYRSASGRPFDSPVLSFVAIVMILCSLSSEAWMRVLMISKGYTTHYAVKAANAPQNYTINEASFFIKAFCHFQIRFHNSIRGKSYSMNQAIS
jgi:hypothetical protein